MAARDVVLAVVLLFVFSLGFLIIHFVMSTMTAELIANPQVNASQDAVNAFNDIEKSTNRLDYVILCVFIGLTLGIIITGWFIGGIPLFMFIYFIVMVFGVIISTVLSNIWETVSTTTFATAVASFPIANNIMLRLPIYAAVIGFIGVVVMFAKPYFYGGQGGNY